MHEHKAARTLVKSVPELWLTCSEESSLGRHLQQFGEIRITRLEPESTVAWEGETASGTVRLEPSGWGTRVTLTALAEEIGVEPASEIAVRPVEEIPVEAVEETAVEAVEETAVEPARELSADPDQVEPAPEPPPMRTGLWAWLLGLLQVAGERPQSRPLPEAVEEPEATPTTEEPEVTPIAEEPDVTPTVEEPDVTAIELTPSAPVDQRASQADDPPPSGVGERPTPHEPATGPDPESALIAALDSLGRAHHRPFSRA
jgi:hypothetical protein